AQSVGKSSQSYLQKQDIQQIPCDDLDILDQLWHAASQGRFGFHIQLKIYQQVGEDYGAFCQSVEWPVHQTTGQYLQTTLNAPYGHFPSRKWAGGSRWWHHLEWMQQRWHNCHR
ncbi:MAG: serine/threonine protein kinase, partial [Symploca sp. SIO2B6]|nr:serine/threonine protein kinase [Symploca sp. SIO2B6]